LAFLIQILQFLKTYLNYLKALIKRAIQVGEERIEKFHEGEVGVTDVPSLFIKRIRTLLEQNGITVSDRGITALSWSIVIAGLLWANVPLPEGNIKILKLYWLPSGLFLYFIFELILNVESLNRRFKKIFAKTELTFRDILSGRSDDEEIEVYLATVPFKSEHFKEIILYLRDSGRLSPKAQWNLMLNKRICGPILPYIKKSLIENEWTTQAVCKFLQRTAHNLEESYLSEIVKKYKSPSVLFNLGRYHNFKGDLDGEDERYFSSGSYYESRFYRFLNWHKINGILLVFIFLILVYASYQMNLPTPEAKERGILYLVAGIISIFVLGNLPQRFNWLTKWEIKKELKKQGIEVSPICFTTFYHELYPKN
jgi:hypothetical protein